MKLLFICNQNRNRSKTAEEIFKKKYETKSAGLFNAYPLTSEQLDWADKIIVMEEFQKEEVMKRFPKVKKEITSLNISDFYFYREPSLMRLLESKMKKILEE